MRNYLIYLFALLMLSCADSKHTILNTIEITPNPISTPLGINLQLTATGIYSDHTTKDLTESVTWGSSNVGVATISNNGILTPVAQGQTTVRALYNSVDATSTATVTAAALESITLAPAIESTIAQSAVQYTATGIYSDNSTSNITNSVNWSSSNAQVATINNQGLATTIGAGTTNIQASLESISASSNLIVNYYIYVTNTTASNTVSACLVSSNDYSLNNCVTAIGGLNNPQAITVYNGSVYIVNYAGNNVLKCLINPNNGLFGTCITIGNGLNGPTGIAIYNGYAYISNNNNNTISYCPVATSGQFGTCTTTGSGTIVNPNGIFVYNGYAYFASLINPNIYYCQIQSNGSLGVCSQANPAPLSSSTSAVFIVNGYAYVSIYGNGTYASCPLNANGSFGACGTIGISVAPSNGYNLFITPYRYVYFAAAFAINAYYCPVNESNGTFGTCRTTGSFPSAFIVGGT